MADNVAITAGSGTTIHADEYTHGTLGSGKTQLVKLVDGTLDSDTAITVDIGDKANALRIAPANNITDGTYIGDIKFGEALPAGTNAIGKLAANSGVDIGDVDVTSCDGIAAEGAALGNGILIQGDDGTDRQNIAVDTSGNVQVDLAADSSGGIEVIQDTAGDLNCTEANSGDILTAVQLIDDAAVTISSTDVLRVAIFDDSDTQITSFSGGTEYNEDAATPATISGGALMMERDDALSSLTPIEGDWAGARCSAEGALWVQEANSDAILADTANMDTNLGTIAGAVAGTEMQVDIVSDGAGLATDAKLDDIIADTAAMETLLGTIDADTSSLAGCVGGTEVQVDVVAALPAGDNNIGNVDVASSVALDVSAATVTVDATGQGDVPITLDGETVTVDLGANNDVVCAGNVANDSVDSGNPMKVGGRAVNMDGSAPGTAVAEADRADFITDVYGRQCVETVHPNFGSAAANYAAAQTDTEVVATPGAGLSLYITDIILSTDTAGSIKLVEDTASAVDVVELMYFAANGGAMLPLRTPIKLTANKNLGITSTISGNHSITVTYYIAP